MKKNFSLGLLGIATILIAMVSYDYLQNKTAGNHSGEDHNKSSTARAENTQNDLIKERSYKALMQEYNKSKRVGTLHSIVVKHSRQNPEEIFAMILKEATGDDKTSMLVSLFQGLATDNDVDTAIKFASQLDPGKHRTDSIARFWANVASCSVDQLQAQFDQLTLPEDKIAFMNALTLNPRLGMTITDEFIENNKNDPNVMPKFRAKLARNIYKESGLVSGVHALMKDVNPDMALVSLVVSNSVANDPKSTLDGLTELGRMDKIKI